MTPPLVAREVETGRPAAPPDPRARRARAAPRSVFWGTWPACLAMVLDVVLFHLGVWLAYQVRFLGRPLGANLWGMENLTSFLVMIPLVCYYVADLHRFRWWEAKVEDFTVVFRAVAMATMVLLVVSYVFRAEKAAVTQTVTGIPTMVIFLSFLLNAAGASGWRLVLRSVRLARQGRRGEQRRYLLVGVDDSEREVIQKIREDLVPSQRIVGYLDGADGCAETLPEVPHLGPHSRIRETLARVPVDGVLIIAAGLRYHETLEIVRSCEEQGVPYRIIAGMLDMLTSGSRIDLLGYTPTIHFGRLGIEGYDALCKRVLDVVAAGALGAAFLPLWALIVVAIRLDSRGPALFRQVRVGRLGRSFRIWKFRTMVQGAERLGALTRADDPRVTRVGRLLRRTSLDELPQLLNVLVGDMSLVGPRAVVPYVADAFRPVERLTLNVLPGMTGLAQVSGRDELGFRDKAMLNLYYIRNYSLILDLKILARTLLVVFRGEGTNGTRT
ncbi:MAG: sugar transferase [Planctomycetes bacterium]|nr:sugar transferase [Planctomycetota bacterium]